MDIVLRRMVESILRAACKAIGQGNYEIDKRGKNLFTLSRLGILFDDALDEICKLTVGDFHKGPVTDVCAPQSDSYWIFKKIICGEMIYIKFKVRITEDGGLFVKSFHLDDV